MKREDTRRFYDSLAESRLRSAGLSCGFPERYDPWEMRRRSETLSQLEVIIEQGLAGPQKPLERVLDVGAGTFFVSGCWRKNFRRFLLWTQLWGCSGVEPSRFYLRRRER